MSRVLYGCTEMEGAIVRFIVASIATLALGVGTAGALTGSCPEAKFDPRSYEKIEDTCKLPGDIVVTTKYKDGKRHGVQTWKCPDGTAKTINWRKGDPIGAKGDNPC